MVLGHEVIALGFQQFLIHWGLSLAQDNPLDHGNWEKKLFLQFFDKKNSLHMIFIVDGLVGVWLLNWGHQSFPGIEMNGLSGNTGSPH